MPRYQVIGARGQKILVFTATDQADATQYARRIKESFRAAPVDVPVSESRLAELRESGSGSIVGGRAARTSASPDELAAQLVEGFQRSGLSEEGAKAAARGRGAPRRQVRPPTGGRIREQARGDRRADAEAQLAEGLQRFGGLTEAGVKAAIKGRAR